MIETLRYWEVIVTDRDDKPFIQVRRYSMSQVLDSVGDFRKHYGAKIKEIIIEEHGGGDKCVIRRL